MIVAQPHANRASNVFKAPAFALQVVFAASGFNVLVIRSAFEHQMTFSLRLAGVGIIGDLIGANYVNSVINFHLPLQLVNCTALFLLQSFDSDREGWLGWRCRKILR